MANVLFKRGAQANLPSGSNIVDGAFYLTTDSNRLYVGSGSGNNAKLNLLNRVVKVVEKEANLPAVANSAVDDFCYITDINVLAVCDGTKWIQINKDTNTVNTANSLSASANSGVITIASSITDSRKDLNTNHVDGSFEISASNGIALTSTTNGFNIAGDTYSLSTAASNNDIQVKLDSANTSSDSNFKIKAGDNITLTRANDSSDFTIVGKNTSLDGGSVGVSVGNDGKITVSVTDNGENTISDSSAAITFKYGKGTKSGDETVYPATYVLGQSDPLDVYTKGQVDAMINGLDGMKFKAVLSSTDTLPAIPDPIPDTGDTGVLCGDVYMVGGRDYTLVQALRADGKTGSLIAKNGDLFIATGSETNGFITSGLQWYYVPSGDDYSNTTYVGSVDTTNNRFNIKTDDDSNTDIGGIKIIGGSELSVSSASANNGKDLNVTINHASVTETIESDKTGSDDIITASSDFTAISGITVNSYGHVTNYVKQKYKVNTYEIQNASITASDNVATVSVGLLNTANSDSAGASLFNIASSSTLSVTKSTVGSGDSAKDQINIELEWGTF